MNGEIAAFFEGRKIEYYSVLDYGDCLETNARIMKRESFIPKSVIIFLIPYFVSQPKNLSAYAASEDYHLIIGELTEGLMSKLRAVYPDNSFRGYGDHSPIDERAAAISAGLGILGDSGLLINEKYGTYTFIADIVTDIPPELLGAKRPAPVRNCSHCGLCKRVCPTGIIRGEGEVCLSAVTQRKGELSENEIELMRKCNTVWGCDLCQTACPHNKNPKKTPIDFFYRDRIEELTADVLLSLDEEAFARRAFAWRGRKTVERNLAYLDSQGRES